MNMKMKEARNYIDTLSRGLKAWEYWINNGNTIIADVGAEKYLYVIKSDTDKICDLDANEVKDVILEREDVISLRLRRINEYGLLSLLQKLEDSKDIKSGLIDGAVNEAINTYFLRIYEKANDLCRVISECEKFLPQASHKKPKSKWWKDGKLEEAQAKFKGQGGCATVRAILRMAYDPDMPLPKFKEFEMKFPDVIKSSEYYRVRNEFKPLPQIKKNAIK